MWDNLSALELSNLDFYVLQLRLYLLTSIYMRKHKTLQPVILEDLENAISKMCIIYKERYVQTSSNIQSNT